MNIHNLKFSKIALIGCVHGDEVIGERLIKYTFQLKSLSPFVQGIIANPLALKRKKRFIDSDLNRSFPGDLKGNHEQKIAAKFLKQLFVYDLCLDIHATNSNFDSLVIVTKLNNEIKKLLALIPINKVALMKNAKFKNGALINHASTGIALEYGPNKSGRNSVRAFKDLKQLFINLGLLSGHQKTYPDKTLYTVYDSYTVPEDFQQSKQLKDFQLIKKGEVVGVSSNKKIRSSKSFHPIFLGKGRYQSTLALMADKRNIKCA
jgi:succinylglutamate desuccinylase